MNNDIQIFDYCDNQVRTITKDGDPWFVLKDVCDVLELSDAHKVASRLDNDERNSIPVTDSLGRQQNSTIINEPGLYNVIMLSRKPEAKKFKRWITHEVLPSIRKHGAYITPQTIREYMSKPEHWIELFQTLQNEQEKNAKLQNKIDMDRPKVVFAEAVDASDATVYLGEFAKMLRQNGIEIGQNRLFDQLKKDGYLLKRNFKGHTIPTQKAIEKGLFKIEELVVTHDDGHISLKRNVKLTGKGQLFFTNYFENLVQVEDAQESLNYL